MTTRNLSTTCCIAGGGPAGMMLGLLLARAGVDVLVLEKHGDFLRDFRGDTIHPSTLEIVHELGLLDRFLRLPHQRAYELNARVGDGDVSVADFTHLPTRCGFIVFMPQWDFLNFLAEQGRRYATFGLKMETEVTGLVEERGRVVGVRAATPDGPLEVRADLVVGADGRDSDVRAAAGMKIDQLGAPMDVLWFRLSRRSDDPAETMARFAVGLILIMINRGEHWQCGYVIAKGSLDGIRERGLPSFRQDLARITDFAAERLDELSEWDDIKLLTVQVNRLRRWDRPGLLCIGDAAHAMSPVGGVGINLAIQDAVATANLLAGPLREGKIQAGDLRRVQRRRDLPTRITQRFQVIVQNRVIKRVLNADEPLSPPLPILLLTRFPALRRIPGRLIGLGVRPEHLHPALLLPEAVKCE